MVGKPHGLWCALFLAAFCGGAYAKQTEPPGGGFRNPTNAGWILVHLEGAPSAIGYQHGYLLRPEIEDSKAAIELSTVHETKHSWVELRQVSQKYFVPQIPAEYREELKGIEKALQAKGSKLDYLDLVTMNAYMEFP